MRAILHLTMNKQVKRYKRFGTCDVMWKDA